MKPFQFTTRIALAAVIFVCLAISAHSAETNKPRVLVTLNPCLACGNPDDLIALVHLFWHLDQVDLEGILPDNYDSLGHPYGLEAINYVVDAYEGDFANPEIAISQGGYPEPDYLRGLVPKSFDDAMTRIQDAAQADDARPLYILNWGNMNLVKATLNEDPLIASRIRLITVASRSNYSHCRETNVNGWGRDTIFRDSRFNEIWWLEMDWTQEAIHLGEEPVQVLDVLSEYGSLGRVLGEQGNQSSWTAGFRAGDAVPLLYLIDPNGDPEDPTKLNWVGRFPQPFPETRPYYFTDDIGDIEWDFEKPCAWWIDREKFRDHCQKPLLENRDSIYSALLEKLNSVYPTQEDSRSMASYEAENANLTDDLVVKSDLRASHGFYVEMKGTGKITWNLTDVPANGVYSLTMRYKLPFLYKSQHLIVNGEYMGTVKFDGSPRTWQEKELSLKLRKGRNSITVEKDWGYMDFDTVTLMLSKS